MKYRVAVGHVLRVERTNQSKSLREVCQNKMSIAHLSDVERGRQEMSSEFLNLICDSLGIKVSEVMLRTADVLVRADS
jgi:transcriptional regulator with XRE-family HTH domain